MKILGSDYDGTLNHNGIDDAKRLAIQRWRGAGNVFAIISGRDPDELLHIYQKDSFECDYLVACSGAVIMKPDGTVVASVECDLSAAVPLMEHLFEWGCEFACVATSFPCLVCADKSGCDESYKYVLEDMPEIPYFNQISTQCVDTETAARITASVKERFGDRLNPLQNGICIDIVKAGFNKAKGMYLLMDLLGASYEDVIVVGDNVNDRDMIAEFKSYAMESGVELIKELADYTTLGVAELIEKELSAQT